MQSEQKYRLRTDMLKFKEAVAWTENERKRHMLHKNICPFTVDPEIQNCRKYFSIVVTMKGNYRDVFNL